MSQAAMQPAAVYSPLSQADLQTITEAIRDIVDYPKPGIVFKDITTVIAQPALWHKTLDGMTALAQKASGGQPIDYVAGIEARGFIFGAPLADRLGAGFVPVRKKGKLPGPTARLEYTLEYGSDCIELHQDAMAPGARVLIVDDLLATGGTAGAAAQLVQSLGCEVAGLLFMVELDFLQGRQRLPQNAPILSLLHMAGE